MNAKRLMKYGAPVLLWMVGLGLILYPVYTEWSYDRYQDSLRAEVQAAEATVDQAETEALEGQAAEGQESVEPLPQGTVAKLVIPRIGLDTYVLAGTTQDLLKRGPGHYEETPLPGKDGNSAIAGHRTMFGHPFRHLDRLVRGDEVITYTAAGKSVYRVVETKTVAPTDVSVIAQTDDSRLTLTTCHPVGSAKERLVIVAEKGV